MDKEVRVIGGTNDDMWGGQYRQQHRVIDKRKCCYAINASAVAILVVKEWKKGVFR